MADSECAYQLFQELHKDENRIYADMVKIHGYAIDLRNAHERDLRVGSGDAAEDVVRRIQSALKQATQGPEYGGQQTCLEFGNCAGNSAPGAAERCLCLCCAVC